MSRVSVFPSFPNWFHHRLRVCFKVPTRLVERDKLLQQPTLALPQLFLQQYKHPDAARHKYEVQC